MFDAVLGRASIPEGRLGTGSAIAVGLHAVIIVVALLIFTHPPKPTLKEPDLVVRLRKQLGETPASGRSQGLTSGQATGLHKIHRGRPPPQNPAQTPKPSSVAPASLFVPGIPGINEDEDANKSGSPCVRPPCLNATSSGQSLGVEALPFGEGMTRPHLIQGTRIEYTREASQARVQGTMILQCTLTPEGRVIDCRVLKTVPLMRDAVLQAVSTWRYSPVLFQGRPVAVKYNIEIRLVAP